MTVRPSRSEAPLFESHAHHPARGGAPTSQGSNPPRGVERSRSISRSPTANPPLTRPKSPERCGLRAATSGVTGRSRRSSCVYPREVARSLWLLVSLPVRRRVVRTLHTGCFRAFGAWTARRRRYCAARWRPIRPELSYFRRATVFLWQRTHSGSGCPAKSLVSKPGGSFAHLPRAVLCVDAAATTHVLGYDLRKRVVRAAVVHRHGVRIMPVLRYRTTARPSLRRAVGTQRAPLRVEARQSAQSVSRLPSVLLPP